MAGKIKINENKAVISYSALEDRMTRGVREGSFATRALDSAIAEDRMTGIVDREKRDRIVTLLGNELNLNGRRHRILLIAREKVSTKILSECKDCAPETLAAEIFGRYEELGQILGKQYPNALLYMTIAWTPEEVKGLVERLRECKLLIMAPHLIPKAAECAGGSRRIAEKLFELFIDDSRELLKDGFTPKAIWWALKSRKKGIARSYAMESTLAFARIHSSINLDTARLAMRMDLKPSNTFLSAARKALEDYAPKLKPQIKGKLATKAGAFVEKRHPSEKMNNGYFLHRAFMFEKKPEPDRRIVSS